MEGNKSVSFWSVHFNEAAHVVILLRSLSCKYLPELDIISGWNGIRLTQLSATERRASSSRPIGLGDLSPLDTSRYNGGSSYSRTVRRSTYAGPTTSSFFSSSSSSSTPTSRTYTTRRTEKSSSRSSSGESLNFDLRLYLGKVSVFLLAVAQIGVW